MLATAVCSSLRASRYFIPVFFRILFGGIILGKVYRYFSSGWIGRYFVDRVVNFTYYGFSWVKPWPGRGMYIHFYVVGLAAACVMAGFLYRFAVPVLFLLSHTLFCWTKRVA